MGLLDDLKKQADALKAQDTDKTESLRSTAVSVDHSLRRTFLYLNDLGKQLNVVQMPSPFVFDLPTVGSIDGLIIKDFFCDFRSKHFIDKDYYGEVHVAYRCFSDKVLTIKVDGATSVLDLVDGVTIQGGTLTSANGGSRWAVAVS